MIDSIPVEIRTEVVNIILTTAGLFSVDDVILSMPTDVTRHFKNKKELKEFIKSRLDSLVSLDGIIQESEGVYKNYDAAN